MSRILNFTEAEQQKIGLLPGRKSWLSIPFFGGNQNTDEVST